MFKATSCVLLLYGICVCILTNCASLFKIKADLGPVIREKQDDMSLPHTFHCILFFIQSKPVPLIEAIGATTISLTSRIRIAPSSPDSSLSEEPRQFKHFR